MCRLAVFFRRPLHEIAAWPAAEIQLISAYMRHRPPTEERIELSIAQGQAMYANRFKKPGDVAAQASDYLTYTKPWPEPVSSFTSDREAAIAKFRQLSARLKK